MGSGQLSAFSVEDELLCEVLELDLDSGMDWVGGVTSGGPGGGPGAPGAGFHSHAAAAPPAAAPAAPAAMAARTVAPVLSVVVMVVALLIEPNPEIVVGVNIALCYQMKLSQEYNVMTLTCYCVTIVSCQHRGRGALWRVDPNLSCTGGDNSMSNSRVFGRHNLALDGPDY